MQMIRDNSLCPLSKCKQSLLRDRGCCAQSRQWPQIQRGLLEKYKRSCSRNTNTKGLAREIRKELLEKYKYKYRSMCTLVQIQKSRIIEEI